MSPLPVPFSKHLHGCFTTIRHSHQGVEYIRRFTYFWWVLPSSRKLMNGRSITCKKRLLIVAPWVLQENMLVSGTVARFQLRKCWKNNGDLFEESTKCFWQKCWKTIEIPFLQFERCVCVYFFSFWLVTKGWFQKHWGLLETNNNLCRTLVSKFSLTLWVDEFCSTLPSGKLT